MNLNALLRPNVRRLQPYVSARDTLPGGNYVFLDANERPGNGLNRYPPVVHTALNDALAQANYVQPNQVVCGNGSDELIDLLVRSCCVPGRDAILTLPPTYGMYRVTADINDVEVLEVPLDKTFDLDLAGIQSTLATRGNVKLLFACSPNNPTGNVLSPARLRQLAQVFEGLVIVDEAYVEFTGDISAAAWINDLPNVVVLRTLSKAYGLAGARLGYVLADAAICRVLEAVKPPYNVNSLTAAAALQVVQTAYLNAVRSENNTERARLASALEALPWVATVYPSEANFLLAQVDDAARRWQQLLDRGFAVRNRHKDVAQTLRFTLGTPAENTALIQTLNALQP